MKHKKKRRGSAPRLNQLHIISSLKKSFTKIDNS